MYETNPSFTNDMPEGASMETKLDAMTKGRPSRTNTPRDDVRPSVRCFETKLKHREYVDGGDTAASVRKRKKYEMRRRRPAQLFDCTECGKTFKHPSKIAEHMRVHTGEKPYRCDICGTRFTQGGPLKVHLRTHSGIRPYKCEYCERTFASSSHKKTHEKTHLRIREQRERRIFMCCVNGCPARYVKKDDLLAHIHVVHPGFDGALEETTMINTVEEFIEQVIDPDDVQEEEIWYDSPRHYYTDDLPVELSEDIVTSRGEYELGGIVLTAGSRCHAVLPMASSSDEFLDAQLDGTTTIVTAGNMQVSDLPNDVVVVDEDSPDPIFVAGEEVVVQDATTTHENTIVLHSGAKLYANRKHDIRRFHKEGEVVDVVMEGEQCGGVIEQNDGELVTEDGVLIHNAHLQPATSTYYLDPCHLVDPSDDMLRPTVEEEVETRSEVYVEVDEPCDSYVYVGASPPAAPCYISRRQSFNSGASHISSQHIEVEPLTSGVVCEKRSVIADPRPPRKGRKRAESDSLKIEVDAAICEMASPMKKSSRVGVKGLAYADNYPVRPARNLDWIIEAVARGENVDEASPHNRRKPQMHRCEYCGRVDKYPSKIKAHMRTHTGERPFECAICGMCFAQKTPMRMHIRRHLNQKPYVCDIDGCGQRFINGSVLHAHQKAKHFQRKRYACMRCCGRSFAHSHNQRNHEKTCTSKVLVSERIEPVYTSVGVSGHLDIRSRIADSRVREVFGDGCVAEVIQEDESDMCSGTKGKESAVLETSTCEEGMSKVAKTEDMAHGVERALDLR
uniref:Zinc finger and BTB domain-containing protein 49 n=1 Tax=Ascaris suum TaxID=6253 RepID=F1KSG1_ASCSU